ncbi:MAG: pyridoxal phosphate-dependent aminotransferase [Deltaproteobacteria bacterium]|nr:pyridoxal phosphate-dependent aminotransferase [Deltaproteobacteria bacterium]
MPRFAERISRIQPSATVAISGKARQLASEGKDIVSFSMGEPDFDTPEHIRAGGAAAIEAGHTRYTAATGTPELKKAVLAASARRRGVEHQLDEVAVSVGAKHALFNLALCLYDAGDEVIIPAPHWVSYPAQVEFVGAVPVVIETTADEGFKVSPDALKGALTPKTKAVVLCSPSNPTGSAYTEDELKALAEVLRGHECWILVDEIYGELVYEGFDQKSLLTVAPDLKERLLIIDGVSKTYAMTGWRIGWTIGNADVIAAVNKLQGQSTTNPCAVAQAAARVALESPQDAIDEMRTAFEKRRDRIVEGLNAIEGIECRKPEGAFYAFPSVEGLLGKSDGDRKVSTDLDFCDYLLDSVGMAVVPGTAFGAPGHVRISYAASMEQIEEGLKRLADAAGRLS